MRAVASVRSLCGQEATETMRAAASAPVLSADPAAAPCLRRTPTLPKPPPSKQLPIKYILDNTS